MLVALARLIRESVAAPVVLMAVTSSAVASVWVKDATDFNSAVLAAVLALSPAILTAIMQYVAVRNATDLKRTQMMIDAEVVTARIKAKAEVEAAKILASAKVKADKVTATAKVEAAPGATPNHVLISTEE